MISGTISISGGANMKVIVKQLQEQNEEVLALVNDTQLIVYNAHPPGLNLKLVNEENGWYHFTNDHNKYEIYGLKAACIFFPALATKSLGCLRIKFKNTVYISYRPNNELLVYSSM